MTVLDIAWRCLQPPRPSGAVQACTAAASCSITPDSVAILDRDVAEMCSHLGIEIPQRFANRLRQMLRRDQRRVSAAVLDLRQCKLPHLIPKEVLLPGVEMVQQAVEIPVDRASAPMSPMR